MRRALDTELDRQRVRGVLLGAGETRVLEPERAEGLDALGYTGDGGDEDG